MRKVVTLRIIQLICLSISLGCAMNCSHAPRETQGTSAKPKTSSTPAAKNSYPSEPRYTYHEFDMICLFYKTDDLDLYQKLLPHQFKMPAEPLVFLFFADYYKMDRATEPYLESAVFLMVEYKGALAWHCVTMPVTSNEARLGGIYYLGYPKIMGDITFQRDFSHYTGTLKLKGETVLSVVLDTKGHEITIEEEEVFERLKGLPSLTIKNGAVFQPKFGDSDYRYNLLQLASMYPDKLDIGVGKADLHVDTGAAAAFSERLGSIFSIRPSETILSYYLKNKFVMRFKN